MSADPVIAPRSFSDDTPRDVYLDSEGQYVLDEGMKVRGQWVVPNEEAEADAPVFVGPAVPADKPQGHRGVRQEGVRFLVHSTIP